MSIIIIDNMAFSSFSLTIDKEDVQQNTFCFCKFTAFNSNRGRGRLFYSSVLHCPPYRTAAPWRMRASRRRLPQPCRVPNTIVSVWNMDTATAVTGIVCICVCIRFFPS